MIYTVTFNPALDYVIAVDHFAPGQINRTKEETMVCGGRALMFQRCLQTWAMRAQLLGLWQDLPERRS